MCNCCVLSLKPCRGSGSMWLVLWYCHSQVAQLTETKLLWFLLMFMGMNDRFIKLTPFFWTNSSKNIFIHSAPSWNLSGPWKAILAVGNKLITPDQLAGLVFWSAYVLAGYRHINHRGQLPPYFLGSLINSLIWVLRRELMPEAAQKREWMHFIYSTPPQEDENADIVLFGSK